MLHTPQPYPAYKPSNVDWLDNVPAHWEVRRLKFLLNEQDSRSTGGQEQLLTVSQYTGVTKRPELASGSGPDTRAETLVGYKRVNINDLVVNIMLAWNGSMGVSAFKGIVSPSYCVYRFSKGAFPQFFHYLLRSPIYKAYIRAFSTGVVDSRLRLYTENLFSLFGILPPLPEQRAIVRYLDHVDDRIRRYVTAKEKLIALLEEERQTVIHRAVTRGLDPNVPLKPSGVQWLGDVPAHWEVRRLRTVAAMRVSNVDKHVRDDELPVRLCNYVDVYKNDQITQAISFMDATATPDEVEKFRLHQYDVLITKDSETWDDIGVPALVMEPADDLIAGYHLALLRPFRTMLGRYLSRSLQSKLISCQFHVEAKGVTRYGLTQGGIKSVYVPLPPLPEQTAIVEHLDNATANIDAAIARARRQIDLLREYRARLIADVVTGKLDVRDAATTLPEEARQ